MKSADFDLTLLEFETGATVSYASAELNTAYGTLNADAKSAANVNFAAAVEWDSTKKSARLGGTFEGVLLQLSLEGSANKISMLNDIFRS